MSQFSTNESISLEKRIDLHSNITKTNPEDIDQTYEIAKCVKFIEENAYNKVCLQFPDYLLPDSAEVVQRLEQQINRKVYVLGDTAYESCCIDFTAAKHISADCIIHFGSVCFSKPAKVIPFLKIYEKFNLDVESFCTCVCDKFTDSSVVILVDTPYLHKIDIIERKLNKFRVCSIEAIDHLSDVVLYVGQNDRKLMNIYLQYKPESLYYFDPKTPSSIVNYAQDTKIIKRRYFLAEKIKDSQTIGIVLSTLAVANYLKVLDRTTTLIKLHEKKYYIISVGKPNVAKLANFPEIDVFVIIGCSMNDIYENRDFFKPIVTVFDLEIALNSNLEGNNFTYDFNDILGNKITVDDADKTDVSLITGQIRNKSEGGDADASETTDNKLVARSAGKLALSGNHGAGFLAARSWQGLEQDLGKTEVKLATKGRKGIALSYDNETK